MGVYCSIWQIYSNSRIGDQSPLNENHKDVPANNTVHYVMVLLFFLQSRDRRCVAERRAFLFAREASAEAATEKWLNDRRQEELKAKTVSHCTVEPLVKEDSIYELYKKKKLCTKDKISLPKLYFQCNLNVY